MTLKEILSTYWSQTILALAAIGYFVQRIYELKLKKEESRHSLFQERKINTIMKFLFYYAKVEQMWQHIPYIAIIQNIHTAKEIDEMIWPLMNDLQGTKNELVVFLDEEEILLFEDVISSILKLHDKLYTFHFNPSKEASVTSMGNEFHRLRSGIFLKNKNILFEIGKMTRKMFNS